METIDKAVCPYCRTEDEKILREKVIEYFYEEPSDDYATIYIPCETCGLEYKVHVERVFKCKSGELSYNNLRYGLLQEKETGKVIMAILDYSVEDKTEVIPVFDGEKIYDSAEDILLDYEMIAPHRADEIAEEWENKYLDVIGIERKFDVVKEYDTIGHGIHFDRVWDFWNALTQLEEYRKIKEKK